MEQARTRYDMPTGEELEIVLNYYRSSSPVDSGEVFLQGQSLFTLGRFSKLQARTVTELLIFLLKAAPPVALLTEEDKASLQEAALNLGRFCSFHVTDEYQVTVYAPTVTARLTKAVAHEEAPRGLQVLAMAASPLVRGIPLKNYEKNVSQVEAFMENLTKAPVTWATVCRVLDPATWLFGEALGALVRAAMVEEARHYSFAPRAEQEGLARLISIYFYARNKLPLPENFTVVALAQEVEKYLTGLLPSQKLPLLNAYDLRKLPAFKNKKIKDLLWNLPSGDLHSILVDFNTTATVTQQRMLLEQRLALLAKPGEDLNLLRAKEAGRILTEALTLWGGVSYNYRGEDRAFSAFENLGTCPSSFLLFKNTSLEECFDSLATFERFTHLFTGQGAGLWITNKNAREVVVLDLWRTMPPKTILGLFKLYATKKNLPQALSTAEWGNLARQWDEDAMEALPADWLWSLARGSRSLQEWSTSEGVPGDKV